AGLRGHLYFEIQHERVGCQKIRHCYPPHGNLRRFIPCVIRLMYLVDTRSPRNFDSVSRSGSYNSSLNFASSASSCRLRATITPSGSTKIFCGMARTPYSVPAAFCQDCRSEICFQASLSFSIAATQSSYFRSKETPKISKFLSLKVL